MAVPEIIPIVHEPGYHTDTIGHWEGGQFFGSVTAAFQGDYTHTDDWQKHKRWYAVLHTFDAAGHHLGSASNTPEPTKTTTRPSPSPKSD
ncbi:hypothetical protein [Nonomuraea sp. NPDC049646]|uniref:hypothetical protein n=1 Tax=unclassified Nonomuraea TaxID=2593643 RepID=UPI0037B6AFE2